MSIALYILIGFGVAIVDASEGGAFSFFVTILLWPIGLGIAIGKAANATHH